MGVAAFPVHPYRGCLKRTHYSWLLFVSVKTLTLMPYCACGMCLLRISMNTDKETSARIGAVFHFVSKGFSIIINNIQEYRKHFNVTLQHIIFHHVKEY